MTSQGITAVPIVGTNVNIVPGTIGTQFIATGGLKSATQNIRPAGPASITMLQVTTLKESVGILELR